MTKRAPRSPRDRMGLGKPFHELTAAERAAQNPDHIYIDSLWDWMANDLCGRQVAGQWATQGPHQPFAGRREAPAVPVRDDDDE